MARTSRKAAPGARHKKEHGTSHGKADGRAGTSPLGKRPAWQGHLRLSLVSCPVLLYGGISRTGDVHFHLLNPETNNRIRMIPTDPDTGPVERAQLVKGYEIEKNNYVIVTQDELDSVRLETTRTLDIERFVDADEIDRLYWDEPYFLLPDSAMGVDAFAVIRDALSTTNRIALGRVVMHTRERLMALEPRGKGIIAYTLRMRDEVIDPKIAFKDIPDVKPNRRMIEIAEQIIAQQEGAFEPDKFEDRYETALRELIRKKERGERATVLAPPPEDTNVIDLMAALRKSLKHKGRSQAAAPAPRRRAKRAH